MKLSAKQRTRLGVILFLPLTLILLTTYACLPAPAGDPDSAKVDDALIGAWQVSAADAKNDPPSVILIRPWDKHSYFLQYLEDSKEDAGKVTVCDYKAWLSTQAGATFITCEALDNKDYLAPGMDKDVYYYVAKLKIGSGTVTMMPVKDNDATKLLDTREKVETAIAANIDNKDFYDQPTTFQKLDKDHLQVVEQLRKKANLGLNSH